MILMVKWRLCQNKADETVLIYTTFIVIAFQKEFLQKLLLNKKHIETLITILLDSL